MKWFPLLVLLFLTLSIKAQEFVHPGGLHSLEDLDRMKTQVAAGAHPWIDSWNALIQDSKAQTTYNPAPQANMGASRQRASADAVAAYLNAIRGYISNNTAYTDNAIRICNLWSEAVNQIPSGTDQPGLSGIYCYQFAVVGEILRIYAGNRWATADFNRFKTMMTTYLYPVCNDFLTRHNNACITHYWANWDICNIAAVTAIGVLCDNRTMYNQGVTYYQSGAGNGCIMNAVTTVHPGNLGQWQETGRDEEHATMGVGILAEFCEITKNQGLDMYGFSNNRLLAGAEYTAMFNLWKEVPYSTYNNCDIVNNYWVSRSQRGRLQRPIWEMLYNHYVVLKGLYAPNLTAIAALNRPEAYTHDDHFGYGTLTFTLNPSPYPPFPVPSTPTGLTAVAGVGRIYLKWDAPSTANGFVVRRATSSGGPYTVIDSYRDVIPEYYNTGLTNGTTYYYVVAATNQAGPSGNSAEVSAKPIAASTTLPTGWSRLDIGTVAAAGNASYSSVGNGTFIVGGSGAGIGGTADGMAYTYKRVIGDMTITARLIDGDASGVGGAGRIGVMIRESLSSNAKTQAMVLGDTGFRWARWGFRNTTGGSMSFVKGNEYTGLSQAPTWFRLKRVGNTFTAYQSDNGTDWYAVGSNTVTMNSLVYAGLAIGSASSSVISMTFDSVKVDGGEIIPLAPKNFTGVAINSSSIRLTWTASADAAGYNLKRSTTVGGSFATIAEGLTGTSYDDRGLVENTNYFYVIKAVNSKGESSDSAQTNTQTLPFTLPSAPTGIVATAGNSRVALSWNTNATDELTSSYQVKRSLVNGGPYATIGTSTMASYTDLTTLNDSTYFYRVSAVNRLGEGPNSDQVNVKPFLGQYNCWPFDETSGTNATDVWMGYKGTLLTTGSTWEAGVYNNGLHLDGSTNGYVSFSTDAVKTLKDFTIAAWIKLDAVENGARVFNFGSTSSIYMALIAKDVSTGCLRYVITTGGSAAEQQINSTIVMTAGEWTHIAVTLSDTIGILYVNGIEVGRNSLMTLSPSSLGSTIKNYLGRSQSPGPYLKGALDEFRIYNQALTPTQIGMLKNALNQTITFDSIPQKKVGDADFALQATASSGLALTYTSSNSDVAAILNGNIHVAGAGTATITALQAGDLNYASALVVRPLTVVTATGVKTAIPDQNSVYPNPVSDFLHIRLGEPFIKGTVIHVFDSKGKLLISKVILEKETVLDVRVLNAGVYFLKEMNGQKVVVKKFVKCN